MGRRILFISKYPEIVQEFLDAMSGRNVEIDTASNGLAAATKLKTTEYELVITGLSLEGYNGEQIITYLNKKHPNTICIIYTTTISPAQLHFFINERDVFRFFLRPVDFNKEFYMALEEAFEYYDVRVKNSEESAAFAVEVENKKKEMLQIERRLDLQRQVQRNMERYLKRMYTISLKEYGAKLDMEKVQQLAKLEWEAVELCSERDGNTSEMLDRAEQNVRKLREIQ